MQFSGRIHGAMTGDDRKEKEKSFVRSREQHLVVGQGVRSAEEGQWCASLSTAVQSMRGHDTKHLHCPLHALSALSEIECDADLLGYFLKMSLMTTIASCTT